MKRGRSQFSTFLSRFHAPASMPSRVFALLLLLLTACAVPPSSVPDPLSEAMLRRLELAREVASFKYRHHLPVRDAAREAAIVDHLAALAVTRGQNPGAVRSFFTAQIAASCARQEELLHQWSRGLAQPASPPRDLRTEIRRDIDAVNLTLLQALDRPTPPKARIERALRAAGYSAPVVKLATTSL